MDEDKVNLWEEIEKNPTEGYKEYFEKEIDYLKKNVGKEDLFLDVGCGDGRTIKEVSKFSKKAYGVDYSKKAVEDCKYNLKNFENVKIFEEDAKKMHFKDNSIGVVFIGLTFSNFGEDKEDILSEIRRILKKDGKFIFSAYNENSFEERLSLYQKFVPNDIKIVDKERGFVKSKTGKEVSEQFTEKEIREILDEAGFGILELIRGKIFYLIKAKKK